MMDAQLKERCEKAIHDTVSTMIRSLVSVGLPPMEAVDMVEGQIKAVARQVEAAIERGVTP